MKHVESKLFNQNGHFYFKESILYVHKMFITRLKEKHIFRFNVLGGGGGAFVF